MSPTSETCLQHILSPKYDADIEIADNVNSVEPVQWYLLVPFLEVATNSNAIVELDTGVIPNSD